MKLNLKKYSSAATLVAISVVLAGCAGTVLKPVNEANKDTSGHYDGEWRGESVKTVGLQTFGDWQSQCSDPGLDLKLTVADGKIIIKQDSGDRSAYIDDNGRFRLTFRTDAKAEASVSSNSSLNSEIRLFLEGDFSQKKPIGRFVVGIAQFGYTGCTSTVSYQRV